MHRGLDEKCLLLPSDVKKLEPANGYQWKPQFKISWLTVQWEPSCFIQTDRNTGMVRLKLAFSNIFIVSWNYRVLRCGFHASGTGLNPLLETSCQQWTFGFHKMRRTSWIAERQGQAPTHGSVPECQLVYQLLALINHGCQPIFVLRICLQHHLGCRASLWDKYKISITHWCLEV